MGKVKKIFKYNLWGLMGWIGGREFNFERYLYLFHRITGVILVFFLLIHIVATSSRLNYDTWYLFKKIIGNPIFDFGMLIIMIALIFHGLNGIRLIIHEYGFLLGKPERPVFPYRRVLKSRLPITIVIIMVIIGLILASITIYEFLTVWGVIK